MTMLDIAASVAASLPIFGTARQSLARAYTPVDPAYVVDYLGPKGDPGDFGPDSVTWRIFANPLVFMIGAFPAVVLQMAEEGVGSGVETHSNYKTDTLGRLQRTLSAAMATTYASKSAKAALLKEVAQRHAKVRGPLSGGGRYTAFDPDRMAFVHLTAGYGFAAAYQRYVNPDMSEADKVKLASESANSTRDYGRYEVPTTQAEIDAYIRSWEPRLERRPAVDNFIEVARRDSSMGKTHPAIQEMLVGAGIDLLPDWAKEKLGFHRTPAQVARTTAMMRFLAKLLPKLVKDTPPMLACRRMGLPDDYLFKPMPRQALPRAGEKVLIGG